MQDVNLSKMRNLFVSLVHQYEQQMDNAWIRQSQHRLTGFMLDHVQDRDFVAYIDIFSYISFREQVLHTVIQNEAESIRMLFYRLCTTYNRDFLSSCFQIWIVQLHSIHDFGQGSVFSFLEEQHHTTAQSKNSQKVQMDQKSLREKKKNIIEKKIERKPDNQRISTSWNKRGKFPPSTHSMALIPAGSFMMGSLFHDAEAYDLEKPSHQVILTKSLWMSKYPCTQELYEAVMGTNPSKFKGKSNPVECVSWCDAVLFCNKLSEMEGLEPVYELLQPFANDDNWSKKVKWNQNANGYRLPTEAEWEYCARGGESHLYAGSNNSDEVAWYQQNSRYKTHPVGKKKANGFGLYDMSGNVWEWVWDSAVLSSIYNFTGASKYSSSLQINPSINTPSSYRIFRGGSWDYSMSYTRVSYRFRLSSYSNTPNIGFRVLRTIT